MKTYKLSDEVIAQLVRVIQEGFLTQSSVVDRMRMMVLNEDPTNDSVLVINKEYLERYEKGVQDEAERLVNLAKEAKQNQE